MVKKKQQKSLETPAETEPRREKPVPTLASEKLARWMKDSNLTQVQTARRFGVDQVSISRYLHGISRPKLRMAVKIERSTKGAVTCRDWVMKGRKKYKAKGLAA